MYRFYVAFLLSCLLLFSCSINKNVLEYGSSPIVKMNEISSQVISSQKYEVKRNEFNSLCEKFKIPSNLQMWQSYEFKDYETSEKIKELVYMKNNQYNNVYRVKLEILNNDTTFVLVHREFLNIK